MKILQIKSHLICQENLRLRKGLRDAKGGKDFGLCAQMLTSYQKLAAPKKDCVLR